MAKLGAKEAAQKQSKVRPIKPILSSSWAPRTCLWEDAFHGIVVMMI